MLYSKTLSIDRWKFQCEIKHICELLICFCKLVLTGSLHEGSCIYFFFNQTKQRKACCITKGTIRFLWFTCSWYKLVQDTHRGRPESSNLRHNQITKPCSKLAKWNAWFKNSFQALESLDMVFLYPTTLIKERMQVLFNRQWEEVKFKTAITMKVVLPNKNKRLNYILVWFFLMEAVLLIKIDAVWWLTTDLYKRGKGAGVGKGTTKEDTEMFNWRKKIQ